MARDRAVAIAYVVNHVHTGGYVPTRTVPLNAIPYEEKVAVYNMRKDLVGEMIEQVSLETDTVLDQGKVVIFNMPLFDDVQCNFKLYLHDLIQLLYLVGFDSYNDKHEIETALVVRLPFNVDPDTITVMPMNNLIKPIVLPALLELAIKKEDANYLHRSLSTRCVQYLENLFKGDATVLPEIKLGITADEAYTLIGIHLGVGLDAAQYAKAI